MYRRILVFLAAFCLLLTCVSCQKTENTTTDDTAQDQTETEEENSPPTYNYALSPYIKLGNYIGLQLASADVEPTEEALSQRRESDFLGKITDRAVQNGDTVNIDYEGKKDGVAFSGGTAVAQSLEIGSNSFIDGFESGLIGVLPGETVDLNLTFPETYENNPDLAGQAVVFTVKVNYIQTEDTTTPELTDSMVRALTDYDTAADYETAIHDEIYQENLETQVWNQLSAICEFPDFPDDAYNYYYDMFVNYYTNAAAQYGSSLADFLSGQGSNEEEFYAYADSYASNNVKYELTMYAIARKESFALSPKEYVDYAQKVYDKYAPENGYSSVENMVETAGAEAVRKEILYLKLTEFLCKNVVVA